MPSSGPNTANISLIRKWDHFLFLKNERSNKRKNGKEVSKFNTFWVALSWVIGDVEVERGQAGGSLQGKASILFEFEFGILDKLIANFQQYI